MAAKADGRRWNADRARLRFFDKVRKTSTCWLWEGSLNNQGYGQVRRQNKLLLAHRVSYELQVAPVHSFNKVLHSCDNPQCVNPDHLFIGSQLDNVADRDKKNRVAHGETHYRSRLVEADIVDIRCSPLTHRELASAYGVCHQHICNIKNNKVWKRVNKGGN